jgi:hypothetical protein
MSGASLTQTPQRNTQLDASDLMSFWLENLPLRPNESITNARFGHCFRHILLTMTTSGMRRRTSRFLALLGSARTGRQGGSHGIGAAWRSEPSYGGRRQFWIWLFRLPLLLVLKTAAFGVRGGRRSRAAIFMCVDNIVHMRKMLCLCICLKLGELLGEFALMMSSNAHRHSLERSHRMDRPTDYNFVRTNQPSVTRNTHKFSWHQTASEYAATS